MNMFEIFPQIFAQNHLRILVCIGNVFSENQLYCFQSLQNTFGQHVETSESQAWCGKRVNVRRFIHWRDAPDIEHDMECYPRPGLAAWSPGAHQQPGLEPGHRDINCQSGLSMTNSQNCHCHQKTDNITLSPLSQLIGILIWLHIVRLLKLIKRH